MARPRNTHPWTEKILELLDGGEWFDYAEIMSAAAPLVPQEIAWNKAEYYREYHYRKANKPVAERKYGDRTDTIRTGQRFIVAKSIQDLRRSGRVEIEYFDSNPTRKKPKRIKRLV